MTSNLDASHASFCKALESNECHVRHEKAAQGAQNLNKFAVYIVRNLSKQSATTFLDHKVGLPQCLIAESLHQSDYLEKRHDLIIPSSIKAANHPAEGLNLLFT